MKLNWQFLSLGGSNHMYEWYEAGWTCKSAISSTENQMKTFWLLTKSLYPTFSMSNLPTFFNYSNTNMFSFRHYLSFFLVPNQYFLVCFAHWIFIRFSKIFNSSNVNEVIRAISNLFIFFTKRFYTHERHKKHTTHTSKQK